MPDMDLRASVSVPEQRMGHVIDSFRLASETMVEQSCTQLEACYSTLWEQQENNKRQERAKEALRAKVCSELEVLAELLARALDALPE